MTKTRPTRRGPLIGMHLIEIAPDGTMVASDRIVWIVATTIQSIAEDGFIGSIVRCPFDARWHVANEASEIADEVRAALAEGGTR